MDENMRLPDLWCSAELHSMVRAAAARRGVSYAEFARTALKLLVWFDTEVAAVSARSQQLRWCVVCGTPRRDDAIGDGMAHAQCSQIMANMERELAHG